MPQHLTMIFSSTLLQKVTILIFLNENKRKSHHIILLKFINKFCSFNRNSCARLQARLATKNMQLSKCIMTLVIIEYEVSDSCFQMFFVEKLVIDFSFAVHTKICVQFEWLVLCFSYTNFWNLCNMNFDQYLSYFFPKFMVKTIKKYLLCVCNKVWHSIGILKCIKKFKRR